MTWPQLIRAIQNVCNATEQLINKLKFCITDENENVHKTELKRFLEWFSPMAQTDFYHTSSTQLVQNGYQLEEIADIVSPRFVSFFFEKKLKFFFFIKSWFYGFQSAQRAKEILSKMPIGAYLFRFSSSPGCYAISVNYGQVGHWRITTEKTGGSYPIFRIDNRPYRSLHHIIETHQLGGEPLIIKANGGTRQCFLKEAADRNLTEGKNGERVYESMY